MVDPRTTAAALSKQFTAAFGSRLNSVVLFGSVARGEDIPGMSDVNILVLMESVSATELVTAAPLAQQWVRVGNTPPYFLSTEEWEGMRDTFAIEIADMQDAREVVYGDDPVPGDALSPSDLRLHAEREIRQTLLNLRVRMLLSANMPREIGSLMLMGLPSLSAYMRAALRLGGERPSRRTEEVMERMGAVMGADPAPLLRCQESRRSLHPLEVAISDPLVEGYLDFAQGLLTHIDRLPWDDPTRAGPVPVSGSDR